MFDFGMFENAAEIYEGVNDNVVAQNAAEFVNSETISESPVVQSYIDGDI